MMSDESRIEVNKKIKFSNKLLKKKEKKMDLQYRNDDSHHNGAIQRRRTLWVGCACLATTAKARRMTSVRLYGSRVAFAANPMSRELHGGMANARARLHIA